MNLFSPTPSWRRAGVVITILICAALRGLATGQTTTALLQQAMRATAQKDYAQARAAYERFVALDPEDGFPLYARFLSRTNQTTGLSELLGRPDLVRASSLVQARTFIAAGDTTRAIALLEAGTSSSQRYAVTLLLTKLLRESGDASHAQDLLIEALRAPGLSPLERIDLFDRALREAPPEKLAPIFMQALSGVVEESRMDYPAVRNLASGALTGLDAHPAYAPLRAALAEQATSSPLAAWLYALALEHRGEPEHARATLENALARDTVTTRIRAILTEELAQLPGLDLAEAEKLYRQLLPIVENPDRVRLEFAGILFKQKRYGEVCSLIDGIDRSRLDDNDRRLAANMRLTALAKVAPAEKVVAAFEHEAQGKPYTYLRELAEAPFALLPETADHLKYRRALQARLRESTAPAELLVLMMSTENQLRSQEAVVAALENYTQARPNDYEALNEYAIAASQQAWLMLAGPHETTPPLATVQQAVDKGARALWQVVRARPYATEPYLRLMELYRAVGERDKALGVASSLAQQTSATAEDIHLAAYLLDEAGYTTESLAFFRRAIERDPQNGRFRMNFANALRKLGRNAEAMAIYRDLFERGSYGHQHHVHQLTEDAFALAEKLGQTDALVQFWRSLATRADVPQRDELLPQIGELLVNKKRFSEGLEFLELARKLYPDTGDRVELCIAKAAAMQGDLAQARAIYEARAGRAPSSDARIDVLLDYGRLLAAIGDFADAVAHWESLASAYPNQPPAAHALLLAAQAELARGNSARARQLANAYLSRDRGDSEGEREAREFLAELTRQSSAGNAVSGPPDGSRSPSPAEAPAPSAPPLR